MISLRLSLIAACAFLIASAACGGKAPDGKPQGPSSTPPAPLLSTPVSDAASRPAPATAPLTLDQRLEQIAATDDQRAQIRQLMQQSEESWQTWWAAHRPRLEQFRDEAKQAFATRDRPTLDRLQEEQHALMVAARQDNNVTQAAARKALTLQQQEKLGRAELPLSTVHRAVTEGSNVLSPSNSEFCATCHIRHYAW